MADSSSNGPTPATGLGAVREKPKKQAVVLIHGIGEQRPMATLWKLVHTVWLNDPRADGKPRAVYSEPDEHSGIFELRRLSTNENIHGKRTDFFEYYWAHLMHGNSFGHVIGWMARLAMRKPQQVPASLQKAWRVLQAPLFIVGVLIVLLGVAVLRALIDHALTASLVTMVFLIVALWIGVLVAEKLFLTPVIGDAARYLSREAGDIQRRQEIRAQGLKLLEELHACGKYDRIIIVGHSLGGVIGYDLITHLWGKANRRMDRAGPIQDALANGEAAAQALLARPDDQQVRDNWRIAQRYVFDALRDAPVGDDAPLWLISDLVTLGAPLAHAQTLLAETLEEFTQSLERREHATSPPQFETFADGVQRFTYCRQYGAADDSRAGPRAPHNAAVFSAVRWTNIFFPAQGILRGDLVGGPAAPVFGPGVEDIAARAPKVGGWTPHLQYFHTEADVAPWGDPSWIDHREALRRGLAIEDDEVCWPAARRSVQGDAPWTSTRPTP